MTRLSRLRPRDQRALRLGALTLLALLTVTFVIRPFVSVVLAGRAQLTRERELLSREARAVINLPGDIALLHSSSKMLLAEAPRLFAGGDAVTASAELARYVSSRATESGLRLEQAETQARIDDSTSAHAAGELRVTIRARGTVLAVYAFLRAMEEGPRLVRVERIDVVRASPDDVSDGTLTLTATVTGIALQKALPGVSSVDVEEEP